MDQLKSFMDNYFFESEIKENESIEYTRFSEVDTEGYEETWKNSRQREKVFVVDT